LLTFAREARLALSAKPKCRATNKQLRIQDAKAKRAAPKADPLHFLS
jgi:hypothetical protein